MAWEQERCEIRVSGDAIANKLMIMNMDKTGIIGAKSVLFVEDNPVVRTAYCKRLLQEGFQVESAQDGVEAMKMLSKGVPDVVVLDLMLPRLNGEEVFRLMQANPRFKNIPVIILSTNSIVDAAHEKLLERASKRLIKDHCTFPILLEAIHETFVGTAPKGTPPPLLKPASLQPVIGRAAAKGTPPPAFKPASLQPAAA